MQLQTKIILFFLSMVLLTKGSLVAKDDIEINQCEPTFEIVLNKKGVYYEKTATNYTELGEVAQNSSKTVNVTVTLGKEVTVVRVDVEGIFTSKSDIYSLTCNNVVKITVNATLKVDERVSPTTNVTAKINENVTVTFNPSKVTVGDHVNMTITPKDKKIKHVIVKKCSVSDDTSKPMEIFSSNSSANPVDLQIVRTNPAILGFEAFRILSQKTDTLTFQCEVWLCTSTNRTKCDQPNSKPASPILYDAADGVQYEHVEGVLTVQFPQVQGVNSADKVGSYAKGLLLTMGAVLLQRQLV